MEPIYFLLFSDVLPNELFGEYRARLLEMQARRTRHIEAIQAAGRDGNFRLPTTADFPGQEAGIQRNIRQMADLYAEQRRRQREREREREAAAAAEGRLDRRGRATVSLGNLWTRRRGVGTMEFRRTVYNNHLYVEANSVLGLTGNYRETSAQWYRNNPATTHRLVPWLNRELNVLLERAPHQSAHVLQLIMDAITRDGWTRVDQFGGGQHL